MVCHDVVRLVIYYFHGREVGFTRRFIMDIWYGILLVFWVNCNYLNLLVIVFS